MANQARAGCMGVCAEASASMGRLCGDKTKTSLAANRTRESRPSGMRGGLAETCTMGERGTRGTTERVHVGNSPPKVARAALLPDDLRQISLTLVVDEERGLPLYYRC